MITLVKAYAVTCDRCGHELLLWLRTAGEARASAKYDHGWAYRRYRDLCPACRRAVAHEEADAEMDRQERAAELTGRLRGLMHQAEEV